MNATVGADAAVQRPVYCGSRPERTQIALRMDAYDLSAETVRRRFAWARRQGRPGWPWPDVATDQWRIALDHIATVARQALAGDAAPMLDGDARAIGLAGYTSGLGPLLGYWLEQGSVGADPSVAAVLALHLSHNRRRMARLTEQARHACRSLTTRGIEVTVLKGMHTAHDYFPEAGVRPASDIDLLIHANDEARASAILAETGYRAGPAGRWPPQRNWRLAGQRLEPHSLCFLHADDFWSIDLQTSLDRNHSAGSPMIRVDAATGGIARPRWAILPDARVLAQPCLLLELLVHAGCGLHALNLLRLVESILVIRRDAAAGRLDWDTFLSVADEAGARGVIHLPLRLCDELAPGTVPERILARCRQDVPASVRHVVDRLGPANAQRVERCSLAERFMWTGRGWPVARQLFIDFARSPRAIAALLWRITWRLVKKTVTLGPSSA